MTHLLFKVPPNTHVASVMRSPLVFFFYVFSVVNLSLSLISLAHEHKILGYSFETSPSTGCGFSKEKTHYTLDCNLFHRISELLTQNIHSYIFKTSPSIQYGFSNEKSPFLSVASTDLLQNLTHNTQYTCQLIWNKCGFSNEKSPLTLLCRIFW
jgi:hypothetical protein